MALPARGVRNCRDARKKRLKIRIERRQMDFGEPYDRLRIEISAKIDRRMIAANDPNGRRTQAAAVAARAFAGRQRFDQPSRECRCVAAVEGRFRRCNDIPRGHPVGGERNIFCEDHVRCFNVVRAGPAGSLAVLINDDELARLAPIIFRYERLTYVFGRETSFQKAKSVCAVEWIGAEPLRSDGADVGRQMQHQRSHDRRAGGGRCAKRAGPHVPCDDGKRHDRARSNGRLLESNLS
jgi:hypothetical protein